MTEYTRCTKCIGIGQISAGGHMKKECPLCLGAKKLLVIEDDIEFLLAKETDGYKAAKEKIKALDENMSDEAAEKLLDEELEKTNKPRRGRPALKKDEGSE